MALTAVALASPAAAQTAPADDAAARDADVIVVTAQKRAQVLADIPQSISVLAGDDLVAEQATSFVDYVAKVPGLSLQQTDPGQTRVILRGINTGGASPTAAVYIDDTPFSPSTGQSNGAGYAGDIDTFDLDRIEVLRGPQGTLYGANSLGGLLKFVTTAPRLGVFEGKAQAGYEFVTGGDEGYNANAALNVPLGDTLAVRASGYYRKVGGFIDTVGIPRENANDYKGYGGRISVLFEPSSDFSVRVMALAQNIRAHSRNAFDADPVTGAPLAFDPATGASTNGRLTRTEYHPEHSDVDYRLYSGTVNWNLGPATLTSATSYSTLDQDDSEDVTYQLPGVADAVFGTPGGPALGLYFPGIAQQRKFTQELRLSSPDSDRFEWMVGGYYTKEDGLLFQQYRPFALATGAAIDPTLTLPIGPGGAAVTFPDFLTATLDSGYKEYAAFGSVTAHFGPRFDITAGGRYSHNAQDTFQKLDGSFLALSGFPLDGIPDIVTGNSKENVFTWSVAPRFELSDHTTLYARVAKGYRPGGPNVTPPNAPADYPRQFAADTLISYEAGLRAETADRTFSLDASVYYLDWKDIQVTVTFDTSIGPISADGNAGRASSKGVELTGTLRPTRGLSVVATVAYNDAHLKEDLPAGNGGFAGDRLPYAPEWTANLSADYEWSLGDATAFVGGNVAFISDRYGNFENAYQTAFGRRVTLDGYATADLQAGVQFDRFKVAAYVRNLTDSRGLVDLGGYQTRPGTALRASPIRPRTIGVTVGTEF